MFYKSLKIRIGHTLPNVKKSPGPREYALFGFKLEFDQLITNSNH